MRPTRFVAFLATLLLAFLAFARPALAQFPPAPKVLLAVDPILNKVYSVNEFANTISALDVGNGATTVIPVGPRPQFIAVNPATSRVYVGNAGDSSLTVVDGATNAPIRQLALGTLGPIIVNPITNIIYIVRLTSPQFDEATFVNGNTHSQYSIAIKSYQPVSMAVDPVSNRLYTANYATGDVRVIDATYNELNDHPDTTSIGVWSKPFAIALNSATGKLFGITEDARGPIFVITGGAGPAAFPDVGPAGAPGPRGLAVNPVTNKAYAVFTGKVIVIDGATNGLTSIPVATGAGPVGIAVDAANNTVYVAADNGTLTILDGATNAVSTRAIPASGSSIAVNPVTHDVFVMGSSLTMIEGATAGTSAVPLTTSISTLPDDTSPNGNPSFSFSVSNGWAPNSLPVPEVYYQVDSLDGPWTPATGSESHSASLSGLAPGRHTIHAFAVDARMAPLNTGPQSYPIVGRVASYSFTVASAQATVGLSASAASSTQGQPVTFTATVAGQAGTPTGNVDFQDGGASISGCSGVALSSGAATCTTSSLGLGVRSIRAVYGGNSTYGSATSSTVTHQVDAPAPIAPTVGLTASSASSTAGQAVTFTATVGGSRGSGTGTVAFRDNGANIAGCAAVSLSSGAATCTTSSLAVGSHSVQAHYGGDSNYSAGASGAVSHTVGNVPPVSPTVSLAASSADSTAGQPVTFTVTVGGSRGPGTGSVAFRDGGTPISGCSAVALGSGSATCTTSSLAAGTRTISATYGGDASYSSGTSNSLTHTVRAATQPEAGVSAASVDFGVVSMGTTSPVETIAVTNVGTGTLTVSGITSSTAAFAVAHDCSSLAAGQSCTVRLTFTPAPTSGAVNSTERSSATLTIRSDGASGERSVALTGVGEKALTAHYYRSILGRDPDAQGHAFWQGETERLLGIGADVNEAWYAMANYFFFSPEYVALARSDTGFVTDLYRTFLDREPDAGGLAFWAGRLARGEPREVMLVSFMFSAEFTSFARSIFGDTVTRAEVDMVLDFYRGLLSRLPDGEGFRHWVARFRAAQCTGESAVRSEIASIAAAFGDSPEYSARARSNAQFVGDLYNAILRRGGESEGVRHWIAQLDSGALTRAQVRNAFMATPEFTSRVQAVVAQGCSG